MSLLSESTVAFISGANRGIGLGFVEALLARGVRKVYAGARNSASLQALVAAHGGRVVPVQLDVTKPAEITAAAALAGDVTFLINNAGIATGLGASITDPAIVEDGRKEWEVNVQGTLLMTQAFAPVLGRNGGGGLVNIGSVASLASFPPFLTYSMSKAAVHSLTQGTRAHLAKQGTKVFGVYPGPIDTDMAKDLPFEKMSPLDAANAILRGVDAGTEEILPDPVAQQIGGLYATSPKATEQQVVAMAGA